MFEKCFLQDVRYNLQDWFFEHTLEDVKNKFDIRTGMVIPENGVKLSRRHIYVFSSWPGKSRETV